MHSTHLRREKIHGLLLGTAIGDALGFPREGLSRWASLRMFGRPQLRYQLLPGRGIYSDDTQIMLIAAQAILRSRNDKSRFTKVFQKRLRWYPLSLPIGIGCATLASAFKCWGRRIGLATGTNSAGNGAATRSILSSLVLYKNGHRLSRWVVDTTRVTHTHPAAVDGCCLLAELAEAAALAEVGNLDAAAVLDKLIEQSRFEEIKSKLSALKPHLANRRSPSAVARSFGWEDGISGYIVPTTVMAVYCILRFPSNFERAVLSCIRLGGDTDSVAAIVGGVVGAHIGVSNLPPKLIEQLRGYPNGTDWLSKLADRLTQWPYGKDDILATRGVPTNPHFQLARNSFYAVLVLTHIMLRAVPRGSKPGRARQRAIASGQRAVATG